MAEPTIDGMLTWLKGVHSFGRDGEKAAILAILEQHRLNNTEAEYSGEVLAELTRLEELAAIRAFVERVGERYKDRPVTGLGYTDDLYGAYLCAITAELAAMEAEVKK